MALVGLYGSLAASASVFIGILTALLASELSGIRTERAQINRRIQRIDARIRGLDTRRATVEQELDRIEDVWEKQDLREQAEEQVEEFVEKHVGKEFDIPPDELTQQKVVSEFASFVGSDPSELNEYQHTELRDNWDDIVHELEPNRGSIMGLPHSAMGSIGFDPEVSAIYDQIDHEWEIHRTDRYTRNEAEWFRIVSEIRSLQREWEALVDRYQSLEPSRLYSDIRSAGATIVLSVLIPLLAYFAREVGVTIKEIPNPTIEAGLIVLLWAFGLGWVLYHLWSKITRDEAPLPSAPEIEIGEESDES